ncbi:MAG: uroporphyrinogen decarboxylase family protein, partial [Candidatus Methanofastidiosia archaeon]
NKIEILPENGFDCFSWDPPFGSVSKIKAHLGDKMSLLGGVSVIETMFQGTPADVKKEARVAMRDGINVLAPGCGLPSYTPIKNIVAMVEATKEFDPQERKEGELKEFMGGFTKGLKN